jgi:hypothetical protein
MPCHSTPTPRAHRPLHSVLRTAPLHCNLCCVVLRGQGLDLLEGFLTYDPAMRLTVRGALCSAQPRCSPSITVVDAHSCDFVCSVNALCIPRRIHVPKLPAWPRHLLSPALNTGALSAMFLPLPPSPFPSSPLQIPMPHARYAQCTTHTTHTYNKHTTQYNTPRTTHAPVSRPARRCGTLGCGSTLPLSAWRTCPHVPLLHTDLGSCPQGWGVRPGQGQGQGQGQGLLGQAEGLLQGTPSAVPRIHQSICCHLHTRSRLSQCVVCSLTAPQRDMCWPCALRALAPARS